jgi:hypothetical protein
MTIFYFLKFETPTTLRARSPYLYPQGTEWPSGTEFRFRHLLRLAGPRWRYSTPTDWPPTLISLQTEYLIWHGPHRKHRVQQFFWCRVCIRCRGNMFAESLPSNDRGGCADTQTARWSHTPPFQNEERSLIMRPVNRVLTVKTSRHWTEILFIGHKSPCPSRPLTKTWEMITIFLEFIPMYSRCPPLYGLCVISGVDSKYKVPHKQANAAILH